MINNGDRYRGQFGIRYDEMIVGRVTAVYPYEYPTQLRDGTTGPLDTRPRVDVLPYDGRATFPLVPISYQPGRVRNYRIGQEVILGFRHGASNYPVVIGHLFNLDTEAAFTDPLPQQYQRIADDVWYHPETGAFIRFRAVNATASTTPADGGPAVVELTLATGASMKFTEGTGGVCSYTLTLPSGAYLTIDDFGNIKMNAPDTATITLQAGLASIVIDPVNDIVTIQSGDPIQHEIDGANNAINAIAPECGIGDKFSNLPTSAAGINVAQLTNYDNNKQAADLANFIKNANLDHSLGIITSGQLAGKLAALVSGWAAATSFSTPYSVGSVTARIKS